jgi:hypothetical protein
MAPMRSLIVLVLVAVAAQNDAPRKSDDLVTVSGCIRGNHLKFPSGHPSSVDEQLRVSEYILVGSKELLRTLSKVHDGHYEEVTGTLKLPPAKPSDVRIRQKEFGPKTRVTVGTREADGEEIPAPIQLIVSSYRHLADRCSNR